MNLGWAVSGRGMSLRAVVLAAESGLLRSKLTGVVLDRPSEIADFLEARPIRIRRLPHQLPLDMFQCAFHSAIIGLDIDWLGLTFNRLLGLDTINFLDGRIFNLHMSLLPDFRGFSAIRRALEANVSTTGVTVHLIDAGADTGPILAQASCLVQNNDDEMALGKRLFRLALPLLLQVVRSLEAGELELNEFRQPVWNSPQRFIKTGLMLVDPDLSQFAETFCREV